MYVWVNASPRSPSSAAPCDNGQELLVCVDLYLALMVSHREDGSRAGRIKREEARDQGTVLLAVVWPSQTQVGELLFFPPEHGSWNVACDDRALICA